MTKVHSQDDARPSLDIFENDITRLEIDGYEQNLGGLIPSFPDVSAMMQLPWYRPLPSNRAWPFCSYGRLYLERVNQFWWNLVNNSNRKLGTLWQSR